MTVVDTVVLGVLAVGLILGLMRGFLSQVTGLVGLVGGLYLASRYHSGLRRAVIDRIIGTEQNAEIAFITIVVVTVFVAALSGWLVRKVVDKLDLGAYDRLMGGMLGLLKAGLIAGGILLAVVTFAPNGGGIEQAIGRSRAGPILWRAMDSLAGVLPMRYRGDVVGFLDENRLPPVPPPTDAPPGARLSPVSGE